MIRRQSVRDGRGQVIVLFGLCLTAMLLAVGLVIDGAYAFAQQRGAQNASDFGALAGARIVALDINANANGGSAPTGSDVETAIQQAVTANGGSVTFGSPNGPQLRR